MPKILVIDDINDNLIVLKALINDAFPGSIVYTAINGSQGFKLARSKNPDVILLDILMPGMDGFEVCQLLKQDDRVKDIPVIFITSLKNDKTNRIKALEAGADAILSKSIDVTELTAQILAMVKIKKARIDKRKERDRLEALVIERTLQLEQELEERKQKEEELRASEDKFKYLFDYSPVGKSITMISGEINVNKAFCDVLGYSQEEIQQKKWQEITHPDDIEITQKEIDSLLSGEKESVHFVKRFIRKNGAVIWVDLLSSLRRDKDNRPLYLISSLSDITEQLQTEERLKESESQFRELWGATVEGITILDKDKIIEVNDAMCQLFGYSHDQVIGRSMLDFAPAEMHNQIIDRLKTRVMGRFETPSIKADGTIITLEIFAKPFTYKGKQMRMVTIRDITERKLAEEALKTSKKLLEQTFEQSPVPMALVSMPDAIIRIANPACRVFLGINDEPSLINTSLFDLKPSWQDINLLGAPGKLEDLPLARSLRGLNTESEERCIVRKDGTIKYELVNSFPIFDDSGQIIAGHLIMIDITERIKADQVQQVLYAISIAALSTIDLPELIEKIREELSKLLDSTNFYIAFYDEKSGMLSTHYQKDEKDEIEYWPAEKSATGYVIKHQQSLLANETDVIKLCEAGEIEIVGTPSKIWLGVPLFVNKKVIGVIVVQSYDNPNAYTEKDQLILEFISRQISISIERKKAEQEIKEALFKAQESDRLKSAFLANMSHEIRTPLNSIIGFSDLMLDPFFGPDQHTDFATMIKENGNNLLAIISDIMDISKIEAGQVQIKKQLLSVNQLINDIYKEFSFKATEKTIELKLDPSNPQEDVLIVSDENRLRQILVNLVGNAIKFTDKGFISIGFKIGEEVIQFQVKDTGIGVPFYFREQIFERFRQVETAFTRKHGGNGLGLPISKSLVELLGGIIWMESEEGKGSTFFFTIPKQGI